MKISLFQQGGPTGYKDGSKFSKQAQIIYTGRDIFSKGDWLDS